MESISIIKAKIIMDQMILHFSQQTQFVLLYYIYLAGVGSTVSSAAVPTWRVTTILPYIATGNNAWHYGASELASKCSIKENP